MDILGRFYTNDIVSNLLISSLQTKSPDKILDLGIGGASLSLAAYNRWNDAEFFATEIEHHKVLEIKKTLSFINIYNYDSLAPNLSNKLKIKFGSIDVAICNPPYVNVEDGDKYAELFKTVGCENFSKLKRITSELIFFAHNLKMLKKNGELGIIISDSLITGKDFRIFRNTILEKFDLHTIIQLPDKIFKKTEARTYILILSKNKPISQFCNLFISDLNGNISDVLKVPKDRLNERMDFIFHHFESTTPLKGKSLKDLGAIIKRGKITYKDLRNSNFSYLHSIHFSKKSEEIRFSKKVDRVHIDMAANSGDILMCRVGKRCLGRLLFIKKGGILISDCVYKISVPKEYQTIVWKSLISPQGQAWLKAYSHGVCSQVISKCDLENYPIYE